MMALAKFSGALLRSSSVAEKTEPSNSNTGGFPAEYYSALLARLIHKLNNIIMVLSFNKKFAAARF
jgi:hypothetical protein